MRRKKTTDEYAEEKRWVLRFDLKEGSEDECRTEGGREFQIAGDLAIETCAMTGRRVRGCNVCLHRSGGGSSPGGREANTWD